MTELTEELYSRWKSVGIDKEAVNLIYNNYEKELKIYQNKIGYWHTLKEDELPEEAFDTYPPLHPNQIYSRMIFIKKSRSVDGVSAIGKTRKDRIEHMKCVFENYKDHN